MLVHRDFDFSLRLEVGSRPFSRSWPICFMQLNFLKILRLVFLNVVTIEEMKVMNTKK